MSIMNAGAAPYRSGQLRLVPAGGSGAERLLQRF
jgi:hypothetical protein